MALAMLTIIAGGARAQASPSAPAPPPIATAPSELATTPIVDQPTLFTADDLLLLEASAGGEILSDGLGAYSSRAGVFLPLGEIARLFDLAITVDPATRRAEGWVTSPTDAFRVDLATRTAHAAGRDFQLSSTEAMFFQGEIYVRLDLFQQLLPVKAAVDVSALTLTLVPTARLPFQERREREKRRATLSSGGSADEPFLRVVTPYTAFTPPAIDVNFNAGGGNDAPRRSAGYDIRLAGDLAFAGVQAFAGSDEAMHLDSVRVTFERKDPEGKIAGPLGATLSDAGDTYTPALAAGARSEGGRGVAITSAPLEQASVFDHVDLRGELQLGDEVELYVNEVLRASQSQPIQGQYEFLNVSLVYGENIIRLVFYGPRGERREEVRRFSVAGGQLARGQSVYTFGVVQQGRPLFGIGRTSTALPVTAAATGLAALTTPGLPTDSIQPQDGAPGDGTWRVAASLSHGITSALTATAGFAQYTPRLGAAREMGVFSLSSAVQGYFLQLDAARDNLGGSALGLGVAGKVAGVSVVARDVEYAGGFVDEIVPAAAADTIDVRRDTTLALDFVERLGSDSLPISLRLTRDEFVDGEERMEAQARVSEAVGRYLISSGLDYQRDSGGPVTASQTLIGSLAASGLTYDKWQLRGELAYQAAPSVWLNSLLVTADRQTGSGSALHLAVGEAFDTRQTSFQVGQTWRLKPMDVSLVASYTTNPGDFRIGVQISLGLSWDPLKRRYRALGPGAADGGAALIDAFVSDDGGAVRRPDDAGVAALVVQGAGHQAKTDASGSAMVTGLGDGAYAQVQVDPESIDNPYLTAPPRLIRLTPRPGRTAVIPYPLTLTGEVEIRMLFTGAGSAPRGLSALGVQLVDAGGRVVAQGRTEYDGTVVLERLRPGAYQLRLDPEQAGRLNLALTAPLLVVVPPGGGFAGRLSASVALAGSATPQPQASGPTAAAVGVPITSAAAPLSTRPATAVHPRHWRQSGHHSRRARRCHVHPRSVDGSRKENGFCQRVNPL